MAADKEEIVYPPMEEVACSEAIFIAERSDVAFAAAKEEFKLEEGSVMAKAQVQKWWETTFLLKVPPMTEEEFTAVFDLIPKAEEGKDEVKIADAGEHLILRAIDIKMVPSRLTTHMELWHE